MTGKMKLPVENFSELCDKIAFWLYSYSEIGTFARLGPELYTNKGKSLYS